MTAEPSRRILLISPVFHGYWQAIEGALSARGHQVHTHRYDELTSLTGKAWLKLRYELGDRLGLDVATRLSHLRTRAAIAALHQSRPDVVVVVKGDQLGHDFWDAVDRSGAARVTWLYDELRRTALTPDLWGRLGPIASYSPSDVAALQAAGHHASFLPLAFDHRLRTPGTPSPGAAATSAEVVFVGARYPARAGTLSDVAAAGIPVRAYGRYWSRHPVDRARTWQWHRPPVPGERDVARSEAYRLFAEAAAAINIHGDQDGLTMRTFEVCGMGGVQLVDRADLQGLYDDGVEVAAYASTAELIELCRRAASDRAWAVGLREAGRARTLAEHTFDHRVHTLEKLWV